MHDDMGTRPDRSTDDTPVSLIFRLRAGTEAEWCTFWEIYGPLTYRLAQSNGLNHHDAQDVVGDVMRALHGRIRRGLKVDHGKGRFRGYIGRAVSRATGRFRRKFGDGRRDAMWLFAKNESEDDVQSAIAQLERNERVRFCLDRLREEPGVRRRDYDAFERCVIFDEPVSQVAKRFGISRGRVYGIRSEMMGRMRVLLTRLDEELGET